MKAAAFTRTSPRRSMKILKLFSAILLLAGCSSVEDPEPQSVTEGAIIFDGKKMEFLDAVAFYTPDSDRIQVKVYPHILTRDDHELAKSGQTWGFSNHKPIPDDFSYGVWPHVSITVSVEATDTGLEPDDIYSNMCFQGFLSASFVECDPVEDIVARIDNDHNPKRITLEGTGRVESHQDGLKYYDYNLRTTVAIYEIDEPF